MTMITMREVSFRREGGILEVDVSPELFCFGTVTAFTIHIDISFTEMKDRIGVDMAIQACHLAHVMDILSPLFRIDIKGSGRSIAEDLGQVGLSMAFEAILI
jgi:hypothetical protein